MHASFRAVRPVDDGLRGLIDALRAAIGPEGTLVMPSWTGDDATPFDPKKTPASADLGVLCDTFWREPGVLRSDHPFAFAAQGPRAAEIVADPLPLPPHSPASPVGRVHDRDGLVLRRVRRQHDAPPRRVDRKCSVSSAQAHHDPRKRAAEAHRVRRERSLLRALCARGGLASRRSSDPRGQSRQCECQAYARPRYRRRCDGAARRRSTDLSSPAGSRLR
ncbi:aminoglycoside 3-N-acetyltransferase [Variibacter gotjawalensis]|uniref:Aminoglycoside N(3)-acetyltransferase n=1 Tax=Variibacter gotjawalensis TaxID=1333996 RepID=A0A0S3PSQ7_9BRAD|nr:aminoglycoside 3-N-acetyltransferase [Variibacter gotjawalensis]